jgi:hypothetical protein
MDKKEVKICAFMTAPRYESTWARNLIEIALQRCKIPLFVSQGVFYGQCMQMMFEQAIDQGCEVGITVDFDSIFTDKHVNRLVSAIAFNDHIDAICAMQARRGAGTPLCTVKGQTETTTDGSPFQVTTAHFGLTAIKMDRLKSLPRPWFWSQPDAHGNWSEDKIDDDIWFWKQWMESGRTIYMDPGCRIGHMEEMVTQFEEVDGQYKAIHYYQKDWMTKHVG